MARQTRSIECVRVRIDFNWYFTTYTDDFVFHREPEIQFLRVNKRTNKKTIHIYTSPMHVCRFLFRSEISSRTPAYARVCVMCRCLEIFLHFCCLLLAISAATRNASRLEVRRQAILMPPLSLAAVSASQRPQHNRRNTFLLNRFRFLFAMKSRAHTMNK